MLNDDTLELIRNMAIKHAQLIERMTAAVRAGDRERVLALAEEITAIEDKLPTT